MRSVWVYINGDVDYLKAFASEEAAEKWFKENDPEGVAFEYPIIEERKDPHEGTCNRPSTHAGIRSIFAQAVIS